MEIAEPATEALLEFVALAPRRERIGPPLANSVAQRAPK
jgi:hypothetical protein